MSGSGSLAASSSAAAALAAGYARVALVLQGGGALGAYQAGAYEALADGGIVPNWLSGVSIGAINAAIIAGNRPAERVSRLRDFWTTVSGRALWTEYLTEGAFFDELRSYAGAWAAASLGQPGFFTPRPVNPWVVPPGTLARANYYDTAPLRRTLERLVDFDLLNEGTVQLSVGAVNVATGNLQYFDSSRTRLGPQHILASAALPPALPAIAVDGEHYWDGGIVSNTPLQYLLDQEEHRNCLVLQVDLFSARGPLPRSMPGVLARQKDIVYSSRTRANTTAFARSQRLKLHLLDALKRVPPEMLRPEEKRMLREQPAPGAVNIVHLIYQQRAFDGETKDYEFSPGSMRHHWRCGQEDVRSTLAHPQWLEPPSPYEGIAVHDVHREPHHA